MTDSLTGMRSTPNRFDFEIVATLGPASFGLVAQLVGAGASALRLNGSHMSCEDLGARLREAKQQAPHTPLVVDLQGAKMRLGHFTPVNLSTGGLVRFALHPLGRNRHSPSSPRAFPMRPSRPSRSAPMTPGCACAWWKPPRHIMLAEAMNDGVLRPRKGVNLQEHPVSLLDLSDSDQRQVRIAAEVGADFAVSFIIDGHEAQWVRARAPGARVVGKVERAEATAAIDQIAVHCDALWVCRGDLGSQLGLGSLASWVAGHEPRRLPVPVLMAGQVLEHLTVAKEPTRSEVCHLYDLIGRGYRGIVLSDETAVGHDPVNAVRWARELTEQLVPAAG